MGKIFDKFRTSLTQRVNTRFGTIDSENIHDSFSELINDLTTVQIHWNEVLYPIISTLPGQSNEYAKRTDDSKGQKRNIA